MEHADAFQDPALTIALAAAAGMLAQTVARHLRIPGIVLLLGTGLLLGPDGLGAVRPGTLGASLHSLVGFAVAVILFEGGMNLRIDRLRREARSIRQLVTLGALVTAAGASLAARLILGWSWEISILFGTLVMVTGPTVITPLLRRIKVKEKVATVLEAEGILVLFARRCRKDFKVLRVWVAVRRAHVGVSEEIVQRLGGHLLFGGPEEILAWTSRLENGQASVEPFVKTGTGSSDGRLPSFDGLLLPLAVQRGKRAFPMDERVTFRPGDRLYAAVVEGRRQEIAAGLREAGWSEAKR